MPRFFKNEGLTASYISVIEINGSHAHRFKNLVERLGIPCLVVTDIDAEGITGKDENGNDKYGSVPTKKGERQKTNNDTLKQWLPQKTDVDELLDLTAEKKEKGKVRVAYQTGIQVKLREGVEAIGYPYTFEDALALTNIELFVQDNLSRLGLVTNYRDIIRSAESVEQCCQKMYDTLTASKKAPFAINLFYLDEFEGLKTPAYIKEGLDWLKTMLNPNKKQDGKQ